MCGIVGFASAHTNGFSHKEADVFNTMLFLDQLRGLDSTGVFGVDKHSNVGILKAAVHGTDFIRTKEYKEWQSKLISSGLFAVGHNRAATRGSISDKNAHPFWVEDKIILVQNGTYKGSHKHHKDTEVDTEAIAHVLAEEDDIEKALQTVNAAYALVWFNTSTQSLNIIRNDERPLYIAYTEDKNGLLFASEMETILYACHRHDMKLAKKPYLLKDHHLVSLVIKDNHWDQVNHDINSKYVYPKSSNSTIYNTWGNDDDDGTVLWAGHSQRHTSVARATQHDQFPHRPRIMPGSVGKTDVDIPFREYVVTKIKESHMSSEAEHTAAVNRWENHKSQGLHTIELRDAVRANNRADCTTWFVWGYAISAAYGDADESPRNVIAYWIVYNKTEAEMFDYVTDYIYRGTASSPSKEYFLRNAESKWVSTCYVANIEQIKVLKASDVIEIASH